MHINNHIYLLNMPELAQKAIFHLLILMLISAFINALLKSQVVFVNISSCTNMNKQLYFH